MEFKQFLVSKIDEFVSKASELRDVPDNTIQEAGRALIEYLKLESDEKVRESDEKTKAADLAVEASSADTDNTEASNPWTPIKESFNALSVSFQYRSLGMALRKQTKNEQEQALELAQTLQELFDIYEKKLGKKWMKRSQKDLEKALNESDEFSKIKFPDFCIIIFSLWQKYF